MKRERERNIKMCPECQIRNVEYDCIYCSECAQVRIDLSNDISAHNRAMHKRRDYDMV